MSKTGRQVEEKVAVGNGGRRRPSRDEIWRQIAKASFAVLSCVTPNGEPRSSGVVYTSGRGRLYVAVAPDSWKALHIPATGQVAVTVPVRRGGLMALLAPIPPATISFHARAVVHPSGHRYITSLLPDLAKLVRLNGWPTAGSWRSSPRGISSLMASVRRCRACGARPPPEPECR